MKEQEQKMKLPKLDDLFTSQAQRDYEKAEKVEKIDISKISDFPNHPFKVKDDDKMEEMVKSIKQYGVILPVIVRPKDDGTYEMISGHRRKRACELAGVKQIRSIVKNLSDDEATILMVDSNIQREEILPSEKAFAYKMKLEAMRHQGKNIDIDGNEEELKEKYDNGEINLYITKQDSKYIINTDGSDNSTFASSLMETYFNTYKQFMQQNYLQENNINPNEVLNIITVEENVLEQDNYFADYIKNYAFLFIMMAITVSATYPATDTTAGERERGTLETLLTFPIKSRDIIVGKFLGVTVSSIITGLISLALAIISLMITKNMFSIYEGMDVMYSPITILFAVIVIIAYSFFISGLCIAIASTSKTFKEAQSALTPLTFISFFPGMIAFMMGITTTPILSIVPFLNFTLIFTDINNGTINLLNIGLMAISTIIYISLVFAHIIKQYKSEKVLFAK